MSTKQEQNAQQFRALLQAKIERLLDDFAQGKISRAQFHLLYERYNARLAIATHALMSGNPDAIEIAQTGPPTMAILQETRARAVGMRIYHNKSGQQIETLGQFEVADEALNPILQHYVPLKPFTSTPVEHVHQVGKGLWVFFSIGSHTTVVTLFHNEPSRQQQRELERLHKDFESANRNIWGADAVHGEQLAYPFLIFIQRRLKS